ncbi:hypothetical protein F4803DRAFT_551673 [Xylaria telfairii]|nr:hypothetical protein F4803DRAFT_551673 [Xylaria telfairii]
MPLPTYLAYSSHRWGYRYASTDRKPYQVIRIASVESQTLSQSTSKSTLNIDIILNDNTGAGKSWSREELNINGAHYSQLAVVVGELLPKNPMDELGFVSLPKQIRLFDERVHYVVNTVQDARIVVAKFMDMGVARRFLYGLHTKQNGLCKTAPLPQTVHDRLVFYPEWTCGGHQYAYHSYFRSWKEHIANFINNYDEVTRDDEEGSESLRAVNGAETNED